MHELEYLVELSEREAYPDEAIEGAKTILLHDIAIALSARPLVAHLLEDPYGETGATDLATGRQIDLPTAVSRNGQLMHALTQDDTHLPAMTHVGATSIPLLLALGEAQPTSLDDLLAGLAAAYGAAESLGLPTAAPLSRKGIRPTPVIGPIAAVVAVARMQRWDEARTRRAVGRAATVSFGTTQAWVEGSHEWLFEISAAGLIALSAARTAAKDWQSASNPLWGKAGLFPCLGLERGTQPIDLDHATAVTRANVKRFPACAINQVPLVLLQQATSAAPLDATATVRLKLSPPEAGYPGVVRQSGLASWSARLMSLPYCAAVLLHKKSFEVSDLLETPVGLTDDHLARLSVVADERLSLGEYEVEIDEHGQSPRLLQGSLADVGRPLRRELQHAATAALGTDDLSSLLALLDTSGRNSVSDLTAAVAALAGRPGAAAS